MTQNTNEERHTNTDKKRKGHCTNKQIQEKANVQEYEHHTDTNTDRHTDTDTDTVKRECECECESERKRKREHEHEHEHEHKHKRPTLEQQVQKYNITTRRYTKQIE